MYRKRIQGLAVLGHPARDGEARSSFGTLWGRSDGSARRRQALPEEIAVLVRSHRTTAAVMQRDGGGEVSRGHSSPTGRRAESFSPDFSPRLTRISHHA